ncbi:acetyl-CoA hydrolase/transferase C-terminal domain-containing protein [Aminicella lysinilytica]|uniref:acetyl-CoA hydrolase/transferase C-terminal domain-containing protein n=1 Tax=Aminicella lysinilytica TaxID=433323 RepID=UPI003FA4B88B
MDFVTGAYLADHGRSFLTMPAEFTDKNGNKRSTIKAKFTDGDIITTPRSQTQYIATEYGVAFMSGKTTWQRADIAG